MKKSNQMPTRIEILHKKRKQVRRKRYRKLTHNKFTKGLSKYTNKLHHEINQKKRYSKSLASSGYRKIKSVRHTSSSAKSPSSSASLTPREHDSRSNRLIEDIKLMTENASHYNHNLNYAPHSQTIHKSPASTQPVHSQVSPYFDRFLEMSSLQIGGILLLVICFLVCADGLIHIGSMSYWLRFLMIVMLVISSLFDYYLVMLSLRYRHIIQNLKHKK